MKYLTLIAASLLSCGVVADELDILANSETLSDDMMIQSRGGNYELSIDNIQATSDMYGDVAGNGAYNNTTGSNTIDAGSFGDATGVIHVVQNTGNNVLIQNATVVNLTLK
ncbi:carbon storage regulator [Photobacterium sp. SDRW27]|uniref:carbon storage regulator n=1 Tax=Photobacterium obscurum TaxID=2829490 RepID=UPI0022440F02|nr:carbon storage regulator [Photobacterium obscurum]MCW8328569.1 carbon storage regulator [Photobacterium obscurum]